MSQMFTDQSDIYQGSLSTPVQGSTVFAEIQGYIDSSVKLSGMPDLTMSFVNHRLLDDVSFHPCVRYKRWEVSEFSSLFSVDVLL